MIFYAVRAHLESRQLDHAGMTDALGEARSQREALFLIRRAVDALKMPAR